MSSNIVKNLPVESATTTGKKAAAETDSVRNMNNTRTLQSNCIYAGDVVATDNVTGLVHVNVNSTILPCRYAPGALASILGVTTSSLPGIGCKVLVAYLAAQTSYIVGTLTGVPRMTKAAGPFISGNYDAATTEFDAFKVEKKNDKSRIAPGTLPPPDLMPGEYEQTTGTGIALRLLFNLAQLNAGDLAKVEACILNDMVRIVDNYFVHHMCGGDELVWSTGKCTKEFHFTSWQYEADGKEEESGQLAESGSASIYTDGQDETEKYEQTGRWRQSDYYGFLGDMVHRWVTSPTEVASNIMEGAFRAGQFRSWVGSDGTYLVQAAGGIHMEVTQFIVIPAILKAWNEPDFDAKKAMEDLDSEFLKVWGNGPDWKDLTVACWQMRYYLKYITLYHSLARWKQMEKSGYCSVPTETEAPERKATADEQDRKSANPSADCRNKGHATLVMDPAGSISLVSNATTSIVMNNGNIQIACPGNLELKAGGTVSIKGKNVSIVAMKLMELVSVFGNLVTKARTAWQALCEAGAVWIKGDAKEDGSSADQASESYPLDDTPPEALYNTCSVIIDASQGRTLVHGQKGVVVGSTGSEGHVYLQAAGGNSNVTISAQNETRVHSQKNIVMKSAYWLSASSQAKFNGSIFKVGDSFTLTGGIVNCNMLKTKTATSTGGYIGPSEYVGKSEDVPEPEFEAEELDSEMSNAEGIQNDEWKYDYNSKEFTQTMQWQMSDWSEEVGTLITDWNSLKGSFADEVAKSNMSNYTSISWNRTTLMGAPRTNTKYKAYPGDKSMFTFQKGTGNLAKPWNEQFSSSMLCTIGDMKAAQFTFYVLKDGVEPLEGLFDDY